jgi:hypothetical protein
MINVTPFVPLDLFNKNLERGFFYDFDLPFYGLRNQAITEFGRFEDEFFGQTDLGQVSQQGRPEVFHISKRIQKDTRIENGKRTTYTQIKSVDAEGKKTCEVKEEIEDENGNKQVRYLDRLPEEEKKRLKLGPTNVQKQGQIGQNDQKSKQMQTESENQTHGQAYSKTQAQGQSHEQGKAQTQGANR